MASCRKRRGGQAFARAEGLGQVFLEARLVAPVARFRLGIATGLHGQRHGQAGAEHGLGPEQVLELPDPHLRAVEVDWIGQEVDQRACVALADGVHDIERGDRFAAREALPVQGAVLLHLDHQPLRQGVDHRHADAVQAAGVVVVLAVELAAGVQPRQGQLDPGQLVLGVHVHGQAATVVDHLDGAVGVEGDVDVAAEPGENLVDAVVEHLLEQVVGPRGVRVHARPAPDRFQPG